VTVPERADVVVVGAGIAGLSAAWELRDRDVVVLESTDRIGGRMMSEPRDPYWLNFGGHVIGNEETFTGRLLQSVGVAAEDLPGVLTAVAVPGKMVSGGRVETYPLRLPMSARDRLGLMVAGARLRLAVTQYARASKLRPGESESERRARVLAFRSDQTFSQFLGSVPPDVDAMFRATIRRSSGEPEEVTAGYGIGYFQLVWDRGRGLTRNIVGGSGELPRAIGAALAGRVFTDSPVRSVAQDADGVVVRFDNGGSEHRIRARAAVVAAPAPIAREMIADLPGDVGAALEGVTYGPYYVGSFLTGETGPMPYDGVYAAATPRSSFNMLFNTANLLRRGGRREPGGTLMVYAAAKLARDLDGMTHEQIGQRFADDLVALFPALRGNITETHVRRWTHGLPHPRPGRERLQPALERPLGKIHLAGDYLGITYIETAVETGAAAARRIRAELGGGDS
jgi:protoporphyrinogen/coproporphyrinogen III oxidase